MATSERLNFQEVLIKPPRSLSLIILTQVIIK